MISACQSDQPNEVVTSVLFEEMNNTEIGVDFINTVTNSKDFNIFRYRNFYNGGGVGLADINNDGLIDVFLTSNMGSNKLYLNKGDWKFEDISKTAGIEESNKWSTGVVMVDINNDKLMDIYVCNAGYREGNDQRNALYINQGDLTFENQAAEYGLDENGYTTHAAFADFDNDGDLDVYILNNSFIPVNTLNYSNKRELRAEDWPVKEFLKGGGDKLLRNDGDSFTDISSDAGIYGSLIGFGLGVTVGDVNDDGALDIYVSNDFFERDYLYINKGNGTFNEELESRIQRTSHSSMGADMADINNDGMPEIFVTDMLPDDEYRLKTTTTFDDINLRNLKVKQGFYNQFMHNTLQLNVGEGHFDEIGYFSDVAASDWSWGALMFDADNDRYTDIIVCNGIYHDVIDQDFIDFFANEVIAEMALSGQKEDIDSVINRMPSKAIPNKAFRNDQKLKFTDETKDWGLSKETFSNGAAYGDLDNDGDLDLIINNVNQEVLFYKNTSSNNWISLKLNYKEPNINAIGSKAIVYVGEEKLMRELIPSRGFQSSVDQTINFGLGTTNQIDSLHVIWPDGSKQSLDQIVVNSLNTMDYDVNRISARRTINKSSDEVMLRAVQSPFIKHDEDSHIDFYYERGIPVKLSKEGPAADIADVNNDGHLDLFIGGAAGQSAQLYWGSSQGFRGPDTSYFSAFKAFEDTEAKFFDADNDGDMDLFVGSGGNNPEYIRRAFRDRMYFNNNGKFELKFNALPPNTLNTSTAAVHDFDDDGDLDLFVGSRSIPGNYGISPGSYIYLNNGKGQFYDATKEIIPELSLAGMITDAVWADVIDNPGKELIITGEWMAPKILAFSHAKFEIISSTLDSFSGWWQSIESTDVNNDGLEDLVLGNLGENFYLEADENNPLLLWIDDFDGNQSMEKIITRRVDGEDMPVAMKRDITDQINVLKKQSLKHHEYAKKSIQDLFTEKQLAESTLKQINYLKSAVAINNGDGTFSIQALDNKSQLSCVNDIVTMDINNDDYVDLVVGGNNYNFLPQFSQLDACRGKILLNDKNNNFKPVDDNLSGLNIKGMVNKILQFQKADKRYLIFLINDERPQLFEIRGNS